MGAAFHAEGDQPVGACVSVCVYLREARSKRGAVRQGGSTCADLLATGGLQRCKIKAAVMSGLPAAGMLKEGVCLLGLHEGRGHTAFFFRCASHVVIIIW